MSLRDEKEDYFGYFDILSENKRKGGKGGK